MAYKPLESGNIRDKTYPSQIAAERPALVTRIQCEESGEPSESIRGREGDDRVAEFNRRLRAGHGTGER